MKVLPDDKREKKFQIAGLGQVLWDVYGDEKFIGGSAANFAVHIANAGQDAYLCSRVGDDKDGHELLEKLNDMRVTTAGVQLDIFKPTGRLNITVDRDGHPNFHCTTDVAFDHMRLDSIWEDLAPKMDAVFFDALAQRSERSREAIHSFLKKATTGLKMCDLNLRTWNATSEQVVNKSLALADVLKLNKNECELLKSGLRADGDDLSFLRQLVQKHALQLVALTLGADGCYLITPTEEEYDPGYSIVPLDRSGAGDAFAAGLVLKILQRAALTDIADFANRLGAYVCSKKGAVPAWSFSDLNDFWEKSL
ncbi:carbohydrate kinase [candidate division KSB1 bacterium]|nr:carbohydrate kinase [candidate division KSB1 bacterium]RQW06663.1 MAG: carbohydrate kinase [candidate division KSB1 bacterium]